MKSVTPSITSRFWLPLVMTLLYVAALGCRMTGAIAHEWIGVFFCVLCILHMVVNRRWYRTHNFAILALYAAVTHYICKIIARNAVTPGGVPATETIRP